MRLQGAHYGELVSIRMYFHLCRFVILRHPFMSEAIQPTAAKLSGCALYMIFHISVSQLAVDLPLPLGEFGSSRYRRSQRQCCKCLHLYVQANMYMNLKTAVDRRVRSRVDQIFFPACSSRHHL